jgi:hypothetical protein
MRPFCIRNRGNGINDLAKRVRTPAYVPKRLGVDRVEFVAATPLLPMVLPLNSGQHPMACFNAGRALTALSGGRSRDAPRRGDPWAEWGAVTNACQAKRFGGWDWYSAPFVSVGSDPSSLRSIPYGIRSLVPTLTPAHQSAHPPTLYHQRASGSFPNNQVHQYTTFLTQHTTLSLNIIPSRCEEPSFTPHIWRSSRPSEPLYQTSNI